MNAGYLPAAVQSQPWAVGFLSHTAMGLFSLILIWIISRGRAATFGLCLGSGYKPGQLVIPGIIIGVSLTALLRVFGNKSTGLDLGYSFGQTVIFVWLYASVCEEILARGLIQGFLEQLKMYGFSVAGVRISLPVLIGALFFGLMHAALLTTGADLHSVLMYVVFAALLGLVAGYQREQTGSIIAAIIVHASGNVGGTVAEMVLNSQ